MGGCGQKMGYPNFNMIKGQKGMSNYRVQSMAMGLGYGSGGRSITGILEFIVSGLHGHIMSSQKTFIFSFIF